MWDTPSGERKLEGHERRLFVEGMLTLYDHLVEDAEDASEGRPPMWTGDVALFDALPMKARPFALLATARHVLSDSPAPQPELWQEAAILATYYHIQGQVEVEIDDEPSMHEEDRTMWRSALLAAWKERREDDEGEIEYKPDEGPNQHEGSRNLGEWQDKIVAMVEHVLDDWDVEIVQLYDVAAEAARCPKFSEADEARLDAYRRELARELHP